MMSGKFSSTLVEAAYVVAGHGLADDEHGSVEDIDWNALVTMDADVLRVLGEDDLADRYVEVNRRMGDDGGVTTWWIQEDSQGFVDAVLIAQNEDEAVALREKWDAFVAAH